MKKWARAVAWGIEWLSYQLCRIAGVILGLFISLIGADVCSRIIFNRSIPGVWEIAVVLLVLLLSLSFAYIELKQKHITIDILYTRFRGKTARISQMGNTLCQVMFFLALGWFALLNCASAWVNQDYGWGVVPVPQFVPWGGLALTAFLVIGILIVNFLRSVIWFFVRHKEV